MKLPRPKAVIFDWDNTLVDTWPVIHEALEGTFVAMGETPWTFDQTRQRVKKSMRDSFPEIFGEGAARAADIYQSRYRAMHLEKIKPLPGAREVLDEIKRMGLYCVVVSNKKSHNLNKEVTHIGWSKLFDKIVGSDDAARDKPHADPVYLAFEKSHIKPGPDVWFIGDSDIDLECAQGCGCTAILYGELARSHPEYTGSHYMGFPYYAHVHTHEEVLKLLRG